jgi:hypothetical protein
MKPDKDDPPNFEPLSETPLAQPDGVMTLEAIRATLDPAALDVIDSLTRKYADKASRDDHVGVQVRMAPAVQAFQICLLHEIRRAKARGIDPAATLGGSLNVLGIMMINLVDNHFGEPSHKAQAYADCSYAVLQQCLHAFAERPASLTTVPVGTLGGLA